MDLFNLLKNNKGTVSSALGKKIANQILLSENNQLLEESVRLCNYELSNKKAKTIRAGAAKIVEIVSFSRPDMVAPYLNDLLLSLTVDEPQTRWIIIRAFSACSPHNQQIAKKAIIYAKKYITEKKQGQLCLVSSADLFLGDYGAISKKNTEQVFPILLTSTDNVIQNEHDWLLEAFLKIIPHLSNEEKQVVLDFAEEYKDYPRKKTLDRIKKIKKLCSK